MSPAVASSLSPPRTTLGGPLALSPAWVGVTKLGAGRTYHQQGDASTECDDLLDELEERWFGPVDVLDDQDEWSRGCQMLQRPADRPEELLLGRRLGGQPDGARQARRQQRTIRGAPDEPIELPPRSLRAVALGDARACDEDLADRPVGRSLPRREGSGPSGRWRGPRRPRRTPRRAGSCRRRLVR